MEAILKTLSENAATWLLILILINAVLIVSVVSLHKHVRSQRDRWKTLLEGSRGEDLEKLLLDHLAGRQEFEAKVRDLTKRMQTAETKVSTAKRHVGIIRYDAFEDVGGSQSFALAMLDDNGHGAVLTGIIGRTDCRIYCKPLEGGKSGKQLSKEEESAIAMAIQQS